MKFVFLGQFVNSISQKVISYFQIYTIPIMYFNIAFKGVRDLLLSTKNCSILTRQLVLVVLAIKNFP